MNLHLILNAIPSECQQTALLQEIREIEDVGLQTISLSPSTMPSPAPSLPLTASPSSSSSTRPSSQPDLSISVAPTFSPTTSSSFQSSSMPSPAPSLPLTASPSSSSSTRSPSEPELSISVAPTSSPTTRPSFQSSSMPSPASSFSATASPSSSSSTRSPSEPDLSTSVAPTSSPTTRSSFQSSSMPSPASSFSATASPSSSSSTRSPSEPELSTSVAPTSSPTTRPSQSTSMPSPAPLNIPSQAHTKSLPIGTITTVAGNGVFGSTGDGGLATAATVRSVVDLAFDPSGDLYLADAYGQCIRMIKASTGIITTVAGTGVEGYSGDGSLATEAMLLVPNGVEVDSLSGNLYITDYGNHRIRMVTKSTGIITTVAGNGKSDFSVNGGLATEQAIGGPITAALDSILQRLYIIVSDLVLIVNLKTGNMTVFAGAGEGYSGDGGLAISATFAKPRGIVVDVTSGNLYIADSGNGRIRMIKKSTGIVTTVAGGGWHDTLLLWDGYPDGIDIDTQGNLYITEFYNDRIIKITKSTGIINNVAGVGLGGFSGDGGPAVKAQMKNPYGIAVNSLSGVVVFSDYNNRRLRSITVPKILPTGQTVPTMIYALAGTGKAGYNGAIDATTAEMYFPSGVALDADTGNIYVADTSNNRIQMIEGRNITIFLTAGTGVAGYSGDGGLATAATLNGPNGVAVDVQGSVYVADTFNNRIRKVDTITGIITTVAGTGTYGYSGDGGLAILAMLNNPVGVAVDPIEGNIYIADTFNNRIRMITTGVSGVSGIITTVAGSDVPGYSGDGGLAVTAQISYPARMATDVSGNLYIADQNNNRVRKIEMNTGTISTVAGTGVAGFSGDGGPATLCRLFKPSDVAVDRKGNVFIADSFNNRIRMVDSSTGNITTVAGNGAAGYSGDQGLATAAELFRSVAIDVDVYSVLYIADTYNNRVRYTVTVAPTSQPISGPSNSSKSSPLINISINTLIYIVVGVAAFVILSIVLYCFYCGHSLRGMKVCNWRGSSSDATRQQDLNNPANINGSQVPSESVNPMTDIQTTHQANSTQTL